MLLSVNLRPILSALLLAVLAACSSLPKPPEQAAPVVESTQQEIPAEALNPDVRQETIHETICVSGYAASVRPSTTYTNGVKLKLMREQAIPAATAGEFELDHRIPLALGGHPRNLKNLARFNRGKAKPGGQVQGPA